MIVPTCTCTYEHACTLWILHLTHCIGNKANNADFTTKKYEHSVEGGFEEW